MPVQLVTRVPDDLAGEVDALVASGVGTTRSDVVRIALEQLIERHRRAAVGAAIVAGYGEHPPTEDELAWAEASGARLIAEEPW